MVVSEQRGTEAGNYKGLALHQNCPATSRVFVPCRQPMGMSKSPHWVLPKAESENHRNLPWWGSGVQCRKVGGGCETFDTGLFVWWFTNRQKELAVTIVRSIDSLKGMSSGGCSNRSAACFLCLQDGLCMHSILYKVPGKDLTIRQGPVKRCINLLMRPLALECVVRWAKTMSPSWYMWGLRPRELISLQSNSIAPKQAILQSCSMSPNVWPVLLSMMPLC